MRVFIFSGGRLGDWALDDLAATTNIRDGSDIVIGADRGALFVLEHGLPLHVAVGDFDSVTAEERSRIKAKAQTFVECDAIDKDHTDTEIAFRHALNRKPDELIMYGALGTRLDHSLANVHLLSEALDCGIRCRIRDEYNEVFLTDRELLLHKNHFPRISLLPLTPEVKGINLTGFRYPLHDATLRIGESLGISNMLEAEKGIIRVARGRLLVIRSLD